MKYEDIVVVAYIHRGKGLYYKVKNPIMELIVTRHDEATLLAGQGVAYREGLPYICLNGTSSQVAICHISEIANPSIPVLLMLIREFVGIHNVVTNLMRATDLPRLFCIFCGSGFLSHCLGLTCL